MMNMVLFFFIALTIFISSIGMAIMKSVKVNKNGTGIAPVSILVAGVFLSAIFLLLPLYYMDYEDLPNTVFHSIVSSVFHSIQLFTFRANRGIIRSCFTMPGLGIARIYAIFLSVEYIMAPVLSFGFIISFFRNATARLRYLLRFSTDAYIFSELNEKSMALAKSIKQDDPRATIVFTDVYDDKEEKAFELIKEAKQIRAICYKKDILGIRFETHSSEKKLCFFAINENEAVAVSQSVELIRKYHARENCELYIFSSHAENEYLLNKKGRDRYTDDSEERIVIRRVNAISSLIYHNLYNEGYKVLYETALDMKETGEAAVQDDLAKDDEEKKIVAVIVGLGQYGVEMLKSLSWFCQMEKYRLQIEAFDRDPLILDRLAATCPELIGEAFQGKRDDAYYQIHVHPGVDVTTNRFVNMIKELRDTTYVLVALGDDELNIRTATNIRMYFAQAGISVKGQDDPRPIIQAIVYNSQKSESLKRISNYKDEPYDISFIGDIGKSYSREIIMNSVLEHDAKEIHRKYYPVETFYEYEYNYRSSCAAAIHIRAIANELSKTMSDKETFTSSLEWADRLLKLLNFLTSQSVGDGDQVTTQLCRWADRIRALIRRIIQSTPAFSWDADREKTLIPDGPDYVSEWEACIDQLNELITEGRTNDPSWAVEPDPYSGINGTITFDSLEQSVGQGFLREVSGYKDNLYVIMLIDKLREQEHKRWNAYMRSEGYVFSGNTDRKSRYDLAKMHHDLTKYSAMNPEDKNKDVHVDMIVEQIRQIA